jgi:hypothetical protein
MKKLFPLFFVVLFFPSTACADTPGKVVKVDPTSVTLHLDHAKAGISKHGMANGGYGGGTREYTYKLTPATTYWQGGKKVTESNIQKDATVKVTADHGVASRVDIE